MTRGDARDVEIGGVLTGIDNHAYWQDGKASKALGESTAGGRTCARAAQS